MFKNLINLVIVGFLLAFSPSPSFAQGDSVSAGFNALAADDPTRTQAIYKMVFQTLAAESVPGYAIAIVKDGSPVFRATLGMADLEAKKKVTKDTIFGLASLTKTFTGLALLHLVDEGKIKPSDTLGQYLKNVPPTWQKLTIYQLASMQGGLPASRDDELPWPEEMLYLEKQPLAYQPGTTTKYSNPGFRVLGSLIEQVARMPYLDYISQVILSPLGMTSTGTTETMAPSGRVSCQYVPSQGGPANLIKPKNPATSFSAGMLASSLDDMCRYAAALLDKKILSKAAYQTYFIDRPAQADGKAVNWAWGWGSNINKRLNQRVLSMNGGLPGVATTILLVPDAHMAVVALSNLRTKPVYTIARRAMIIYLTGDDINQPAEPGSGNDSRQDSSQGFGQNASQQLSQRPSQNANQQLSQRPSPNANQQLSQRPSQNANQRLSQRPSPNANQQLSQRPSPNANQQLSQQPSQNYEGRDKSNLSDGP
jgi:CubicO group peptidase (beta-lactamase class C family)